MARFLLVPLTVMHFSITSMVRKSIIEYAPFKKNTGASYRNTTLNLTNAMFGTDCTTHISGGTLWSMVSYH